MLNLVVKTLESAVITRGGIVTKEYRLTQGNTTEDSGIRKVAEKTQTFDAKKERQTFEEARKEFRGDQGSFIKDKTRSKRIWNASSI
jgi:hypothetical protein